MRSKKYVNVLTDHLSQDQNKLKQWLDEAYERFNQPLFIAEDPISVPHRFSLQQDKEIAALFASIIAWGRRASIIQSANKLMHLMDDAPYDFILNHKEEDGKRFLKFVHRTFQPDDVLGLMRSLQRHYQANYSLETAFLRELNRDDENIEGGLISFSKMIFSHSEIMDRTRKHIPTPERKSSCKRLNMFLRWMVRKDDKGVDFGIWKNISPHQLIIPLDVHVGNVARQLGLLKRDKNDWQAAVELTRNLREFDPNDPVKYDFALFGAGISKLQIPL